MKSLLLLPNDYHQYENVQKMVGIYTGKDVETSTQAYRDHFVKLGTWDSWISHLASGRDYLSQKPLYMEYICVQEYLGRANAHIINKALEEGKSCSYLDSKGVFHSIVGVHYDDEGWKISYMKELV